MATTISLASGYTPDANGAAAPPRLRRNQTTPNNNNTNAVDDHIDDDGWSMPPPAPPRQRPKPKQVTPPSSPDTITALLNTCGGDETPALITETSHPFRILGVNAAWTKLCGFKDKEVVSLTPALLQASTTDKAAAKAFTTELLASGEATTTLTNRTKAGSDFRHRLTGWRVVAPDGQSLFVAQSTVLEAPRAAKQQAAAKGGAKMAAATVAAAATRSMRAPAYALLVVIAALCAHLCVGNNNNNMSAATTAAPTPAAAAAGPRGGGWRQSELLGPITMSAGLGERPYWPTTPIVVDGEKRGGRPLERARKGTMRALRGIRGAAEKAVMPFGVFLPAAVVVNLDLFLLGMISGY